MNKLWKTFETTKNIESIKIQKLDFVKKNGQFNFSTTLMLIINFSVENSIIG
jgi:hypothetical protein